MQCAAVNTFVGLRTVPVQVQTSPLFGSSGFGVRDSMPTTDGKSVVLAGLPLTTRLPTERFETWVSNAGPCFPNGAAAPNLATFRAPGGTWAPVLLAKRGSVG